jgi:type IV pilus assembly protein PilA
MNAPKRRAINRSNVGTFPAEHIPHVGFHGTHGPVQLGIRGISVSSNSIQPIHPRNNFMKKNMQGGFTLIELMIVVAIIAILAAIALPAYQDYTTRAKVSELVVAADACKTSVTEYYQSQQALPTDLAASGCSSNATQYITSLGVATGIITVTGNATGAGHLPTAAAGTLILTPVAGATTDLPLAWTCGGTIAKKFLPASCR